MISALDLNIYPDAIKKLCNDTYIDSKPVISHSSKENFISCRQAFYYSKICGIRKKDEHVSGALKAGKTWDTFIDYVYQGYSFTDKFEEMRRELNIYYDDYLKLKALMYAYEKLKIKPEPNGQPQKGFYLYLDRFYINGYIDIHYSDHFEEHKLSTRPENYIKIPFIESQIGTYFLSNPDYKYCVMKVARMPGLRKGVKESDGAYLERLKKDIVNRSNYYFPGLRNGSYGTHFYRKEFNLEQLQFDYQYVIDDIITCVQRDQGFYQNKKSCSVPFMCDYGDICKTKCVSEEIYNIKERV